MAEEKERFYSRLASVPGVQPLPSIGDWILVRVKDPADLARKLNRRFDVHPFSIPRHIRGAMRITVCDPKTNELMLLSLRELVA